MRRRRRDKRLDLAAVMPDGDELASVPDVVQRIRGEDQEVGALSILQGAAIGDAEHRGASSRRGDQRIHRPEPGADHQLELPVLRPALDPRRIGAGIGAAAGLAAVLLTRGPDAELPRGSTMDVVFERELSLDGSQIQFTNVGQFQPVVQPPVRQERPQP